MSKGKRPLILLISLALILATAACGRKEETKSNMKDQTAKIDYVESTKQEVLNNGMKAKFLPPEGKAWLMIGQDLGAIGGFDDYSQGYVDYVGIPAGVTVYTDIANLKGLYSLANWGSGDTCAQYYLENDKFKDVMIAVGLYMAGDLDNVISGIRDESIKLLGEWIKKANRPIFLRIGYEFDLESSGYEPEKYKLAFKKVVDGLKSNGVENFVSVWQSTENGTVEHLMKWYPGDEYVDWLAYSYFEQIPERIGQGMLSIAREKHKPVFIAESTPKRRIVTIGNANENWDYWFKQYFDHIRSNADVIKAVSYINVSWMDQPMWSGDDWGDSRVQVDEKLKQLWISEIKKDDFWITGKFNEPGQIYNELDVKQRD